jgi:hypothetical protein
VQSAAVARWISLVAATYATALSALYLQGAVPRHRPESAWFAAALLGGLAGLLRGDLSGPAARLADPAPVDRWPAPWAATVAPVALSLAIYGSMLGTGLLSDDFGLLARAGAGQLTMGNEFFRPLPFLVWSTESWLGGAAGLLFHLTNVLVHGLNAVLVGAVARSAGLSTTAQAMAVAVFLLHPVGVEAVVWISALPDGLATTGTLVTVLGSLSGSAVVTGMGLAIAVLSKESGVAAPLIALVVCWAAGRRLRLPLAGLGIVVPFVLLRVWFLPLPGEYVSAPTGYLLKELVSRTIGGLAAPWGSAEMSAFGPMLTAATCAACALVVVSAARGSIGERARLVLAGAAWALLATAPVYSYLFVSEHMEGSRYLYLASGGWALGLAALVAAQADGNSRMWRVVALTLTAVVVAGSLLAVQVRLQAWHDAAAIRDEVLASAARVLTDPRCETVMVTGLPEDVRGAFVFRNGFAEALRRNLPAVRLVPSEASCAFAWTPEGFTAVRAVDRP